MDMDLWWCPVCERAITEQEELKSHSTIPTQPRYTSRGGVYGPKGSLYCSDACREVDRLNSQLAFEQLATCLLPYNNDRPSPPELPESESTISGTDSRSLSLQRSSHPSSEQLNPLTTTTNNQPSTGAASRRGVPILISPNGTPLIQPTFPQRPALGPHQARHHSHHSTPQKKNQATTTTTRTTTTTTTTTTAIRTNSTLKITTTALLPKPSSSVPIYPSTHPSTLHLTQPSTILNHQLKLRNDMEFSPEARSEKPTSLLQHYGLFFRVPPASRSGPQGHDHEPHPHLPRDGCRSVGLLRRHLSTQTHKTSRRSSLQPSKHSNQSPTPSPATTTTTTATKKNRLSMTRVDSSRPNVVPSRSWTWDHLPPDVPQYPAMNLAQIRLNKLLTQPSLHSPSSTHDHRPTSSAPHNPLDIRPDPLHPFLNTVSTDLNLVQSKKKLFVFHS